MRQIILIATLVGLAGCDSKQSTSTPEQDEPAETTVETTAQTPIATVEAFEFDDNAITEHLPAGEPLGGFAFTDALGKNYVAFSRDEISSKGSRETVLRVRHLLQSDGGFEEVRAFREIVADCEFDTIMEPQFGEWSVSDVDGDGIGEATFASTFDCVSDVSPLNHKVVMAEKGVVYELRGKTAVKLGPNDVIGGGFEADEMPPQFASHAKVAWEETYLGTGF